MIMTSINKISKKNTAYLVFILIFFTRDSLLFGTKNDTYFLLFNHLVVFSVFCVLTYYTFIKKSVIEKNSLIIFLILITLLTTTSLLNLDISLKYFYEFLMMSIAMLTACNVSLKNFQTSYIKVTCFLAAFSLLSYTLSIIAYPILDIFPVITNKAGYKFYCLGFSNVMQNTPFIFKRNYGFAREPGVFIFYLIIAIIFTLSAKNLSTKTRSITLLILIVTTLTTFSTAGYIILLLILVYYIFFLKRLRAVYSVLLFITFSTLLIVFAFQNNTIWNVVFGKLFVSNSSLNSRLVSISVNIYIAFSSIKNILFGCGFKFIENNFASISSILGMTIFNNTNTILKMLAVHGAIYTSTICMMLYNFGKKLLKTQKPLPSICIFLLYLLLFSNQDLIFNIIIYVMAFYGINSNKTLKCGDNLYENT